MWLVLLDVAVPGATRLETSTSDHHHKRHQIHADLSHDLRLQVLYLCNLTKFPQKLDFVRVLSPVTPKTANTELAFLPFSSRQKLSQNLFIQHNPFVSLERTRLFG